jgi:putative tricarboxylic transport membrane protein
LGPIAEANFTQGSMIANAQDGPLTYFLNGPLNIFLIVLVLASIAYSFWTSMISPQVADTPEVKS